MECTIYKCTVNKRMAFICTAGMLEILLVLSALFQKFSDILFLFAFKIDQHFVIIFLNGSLIECRERVRGYLTELCSAICYDADNPDRLEKCCILQWCSVTTAEELLISTFLIELPQKLIWIL